MRGIPSKRVSTEWRLVCLTSSRNHVQVFRGRGLSTDAAARSLWWGGGDGRGEIYVGTGLKCISSRVPEKLLRLSGSRVRGVAVRVMGWRKSSRLGSVWLWERPRHERWEIRSLYVVFMLYGNFLFNVQTCEKCILKWWRSESVVVWF